MGEFRAELGPDGAVIVTPDGARIAGVTAFRWASGMGHVEFVVGNPQRAGNGQADVERGRGEAPDRGSVGGGAAAGGGVLPDPAQGGAERLKPPALPEQQQAG